MEPQHHNQQPGKSCTITASKYDNCTGLRAMPRTVEHRVCDEAARVQHLAVEGAQRVAVRQLAGVRVEGARQLLVAARLDVAAVVLVEVCQLVVQVDGRLHGLRDGERHDAGRRARAALHGKEGEEGQRGRERAKQRRVRWGHAMRLVLLHHDAEASCLPAGSAVQGLHLHIMHAAAVMSHES